MFVIIKTTNGKIFGGCAQRSIEDIGRSSFRHIMCYFEQCTNIDSYNKPYLFSIDKQEKYEIKGENDLSV